MPDHRLFRQLGETRTQLSPTHAFIAPDGHVETPLPDWSKSQAIILISPQMGARFTHYLALMQAGGEGTPPLPGIERFIYVLEGSIELQTETDELTLNQHGYAFFPDDSPHVIRSSTASRLNIFERRFVARSQDDTLPVVVGNARDVAGEAFLGDPNVTVRKFLPDDPRFDMAVNTMSFKPGATLPFAETHVMEHGMLMLKGGGIYRLNRDWYPIQEGDVLWMGPYCPQWFGALGMEGSSYLLYKEANRDVFRFEKES